MHSVTTRSILSDRFAVLITIIVEVTNYTDLLHACTLNPSSHFFQAVGFSHRSDCACSGSACGERLLIRPTLPHTISLILDEQIMIHFARILPEYEDDLMHEHL